MINLEDLEEFKQIIFEDYGIKLTDQQALQDALAFLDAFRILVVDTFEEKDGNVS